MPSCDAMSNELKAPLHESRFVAVVSEEVR